MNEEKIKIDDLETRNRELKCSLIDLNMRHNQQVYQLLKGHKKQIRKLRREITRLEATCWRLSQGMKK